MPALHRRTLADTLRAVPVVFYDVTTSPFSANTVTESLIRRGRQREIEIGASQYFVNVLALVTLVVARSRDEFRVSSFACKYLVGVRKIALVDRVSLAGWLAGGLARKSNSRSPTTLSSMPVSSSEHRRRPH